MTTDPDGICPECENKGTTPCGLCLDCTMEVINGKELKTVAGNVVAATIRERITKKYGATPPYGPDKE